MGTAFGSALRMSSILVLVAVPGWAMAASQQVDLKLVLATDVSRSIDDTEMQLEREGTADAFLDPAVINAIQSGALGKIAVAAFDFSSPEMNQVTINWRIIHDRASAIAFAETLRHTPRSDGRRTSISGALETAALLLTSSEADIVTSRNVIDVSGDGPNNDGNPMQEVHDKIVAQNITINGLPVMDDAANGYYPNLDKYYAGCVAGGKGAFVVVVRKYADFSAAMRHKLILEISENANGSQFASTPSPKRSLLIKVAATNNPPEVLRPDKSYPGGCDVEGGGGGYGRYGGFGGFGGQRR